jgi:hypothetical protein
VVEKPFPVFRFGQALSETTVFSKSAELTVTGLLRGEVEESAPASQSPAT